MADDKSKTNQRVDPRIAALQQKRAAALAKGGPNLSAASTAQFLRDTWSELKKTTWPDRQTLMKSTTIVLAFIAATAVWVGIFDLILTHATAPFFGK